MRLTWIPALLLFAACGGEDPESSREVLPGFKKKMTLHGNWQWREPVRA